MQAALTAAQRGHKVTLVEQKDRLGGILNFTDVDVNKEDLRNFKNVLIREVEEVGIEVRLNTTGDESLIKEINPEAIIIAVGARPATPPIPGIENVRSAIDVYSGYEPGKEVIMVGGGLVGSETALHLAKTGHRVTIVEMLDRLADDSYGMYREALMLEMDKENIIGLTNARCVEITPNSVRIEVDGVEKRLTGDTVIYALGMKPVDTTALKAAAGIFLAT